MARRKSIEWMPMYWGDYDQDADHLKATEHGAYLMLIKRYWQNGPLPDDDAKLLSFAKVTKRQWLRIKDTIRAFFRVVDGVWHHKRIDAELAKARALIKRKAATFHAGRGNLFEDSAERKKPNDSSAPRLQTQDSESERRKEPRAAESSPVPPTPRAKKHVVCTTTIPKDWLPDAASEAYAREEHGLSAGEIRAETNKFRNKYGGNATVTKTDWQAHFRYWLDCAPQFKGRGDNGRITESERYDNISRARREFFGTICEGRPHADRYRAADSLPAPDGREDAGR
jgi:uncharacterized protein YdaU (DUF1376 family)